MDQETALSRLKSLGISQRQASRHIGVTETHMSRMLHGKQDAVPSPSLLTYIEIMGFLNESDRRMVLKALDALHSGASGEAQNPSVEPGSLIADTEATVSRGRPSVQSRNPVAYAFAKMLWHDNTVKSGQEVSDRSGISLASLNREFGARKQAKKTSQK